MKSFFRLKNVCFYFLNSFCCFLSSIFRVRESTSTMNENARDSLTTTENYWEWVESKRPFFQLSCFFPFDQSWKFRIKNQKIIFIDDEVLMKYCDNWIYCWWMDSKLMKTDENNKKICCIWLLLQMKKVIKKLTR